jgi:hypothetical protein
MTMLKKWAGALRGFGRAAAKPAAEGPEWVQRLDRLADGVNERTRGLRPGCRVLMGPAFSIYGPSYAHDRLLSLALRLRGAEVIPFYCDSIQRDECNVYGGVWGGARFAENCAHCAAESARLWSRSPVAARKASEFLRPGDREDAERKAAGLSGDDWIGYAEDGMPFGHWAKDILVNNYVVGDHRIVADHGRLGRAHLRNLLLLRPIYERLLDETKPDRVLTNDSYYGMWALMEALCRRRGIPFYSYWPQSKERTAFSSGPSMEFDFRKPWPRFSAQPLSPEMERRVDEWMEGHAGKRGTLIDTSSVQQHCTEEPDLGKVDAAKPTALLAANVIWDLAALNKQVVFGDMMEWIAATIEWFGRHPEYELIVKAHPAEQHPSIPETRERVALALEDRGVRLPANVHLLSPKARVTVYELLPRVKAGIVHTTTVGLEMAARGMPVLTSGRAPYRGYGFTLDPGTPQAYFADLERALRGGCDVGAAQRIDLARKFAAFHIFHYYARLGLTENDWKKPPRILAETADDLLPGRRPALDYMLESILGGLPILDENRWPPES